MAAKGWVYSVEVLQIIIEDGSILYLIMTKKSLKEVSLKENTLLR